jgi:hypothetical protein
MLITRIVDGGELVVVERRVGSRSVVRRKWER